MLFSKWTPYEILRLGIQRFESSFTSLPNGARGGGSLERIDDVMDEVTEEKTDEMTWEEAAEATGRDG
jgi:hypothetical protein